MSRGVSYTSSYQYVIILASQMADMSALFSRAMHANLVPGLTYLIMYAQKIQTENGMRLFVKLRAAPQNIFCKVPEGLAYLFSDYQIDQINNEKLFVNLSFWGNHFLGIRLYR